jgi:signal transduction histidine kinase
VAAEPNLTPAAPAASSVRELRIAGEIAQAFLSARKPHEVYRLALERVAPLVGAAFACVFLRDQEPDLLRVVTAYNWPQRYAGYLGSMRVRVGNGPTGRAVLDNASFDVADVFADPELSDWWDSARELRFRSAIALPLAVEGDPIGSLTFYFRDSEAFAEADRGLLRLVADQLAATAEKARLLEDLQQANDRLREQNVDLTARYHEAEEAKRVKNEFLANVSHELRTPLTAMLGYAFLLREGISGALADDQLSTVRKIEEAGGQLVSLIDGLMDLTRLRLGRMEPERELCDAASLARAAIANAPSPNAGVGLLLDVADERVPIHTDPAFVLRILQSFIANAVKFTQQGSITLRLRANEAEPTEQGRSRGNEIIWEVVDTGIGIDEKYHEVIFEEFRHAESSATRRHTGAGLGLAVARGLAQRLGGDVEVSSSPGAGATFRLVLPSSVVRAGAS